jgi:group I intron endonuclease
MKDIVSGIYGIKNIVNGKIYVGQASDIHWRWVHHQSDLRNNRHHNKHLQYSWNKYGEQNFDFYIIEECSIDDLDEKENYWINKLRTYEGFDDCNGYNQDLGGKGIRGYKHSDDQILKMRMIQNPKTVLQFDLQFNLIKEWIGGVSHINKELGYTKECILIRCEHTILNKMTSYKNAYWIYKDEYNHDGFSWDDYFSNYRKKDDKIICQYDLQFNLVQKWNSHFELKEAGYNINSILRICNHSGTSRTYNNYIWTYDGYDFSDGYFGFYNEYKKGRHNCRKVNMKSEKDGDIIKTFNSVSDACIYIGKPVKFRGNIIASLAKGQRSGGYYWEYAD